MDMKIEFGGRKKVNAVYKDYTINTDQPKTAGGDGSAPAPFDLYLASIGTCVGFYIQFFCQRHDIPMEYVQLTLKTERDISSGLIGKIILDIQVTQDFPEKFVNALKSVAEQCVVKKQILNPPDFDIQVVGGDYG